jgi:hypothetical protein
VRFYESYCKLFHSALVKKAKNQSTACLHRQSAGKSTLKRCML